MQLAVMTATLAHRGVRIRPQMVQRANDEFLAPVIEDRFDVAEAHWDAIFDGMAEVMHGQRGTADGGQVGHGAGCRYCPRREIR